MIGAEILIDNSDILHHLIVYGCPDEVGKLDTNHVSSSHKTQYHSIAILQLYIMSTGYMTSIYTRKYHHVYVRTHRILQAQT